MNEETMTDYFDKLNAEEQVDGWPKSDLQC